MNETSVTVVGNIGSDVTQRRVGVDGQVVVSFRVVSSARRRDRLTGEWVDGDRFSARVSCWRRLGEHVLTTLVKGDPVVVQGRVCIREYEVDGERRFSTEITAASVGPDLARCRAEVTRRTSEEAERVAGPSGEVAAPGLPAGAVPAIAAAGAPDPSAGVTVPSDWAVALLDADATTAAGTLDADPWAVPLEDAVDEAPGRGDAAGGRVVDAA